MAESNFLKCSVKEFTTKNNKTGYNISINIQDLKRFPVSDKGYVNLTMRQRNEKGKYGDTHFIVENEYAQTKKEQKNNIDGIPDNGQRIDDLPF